ncbi:hypothetical protein [Bacteroides faecichinchillae]
MWIRISVKKEKSYIKTDYKSVYEAFAQCSLIDSTLASSVTK